MELTKIQVPCESAPLCPECEQHQFSDSDRGTVFCPQCQSRFLIRVDPLSGETTLSYFIKSGSWAPADASHTQPGVSFDPSTILDPGVREALCGTRAPIKLEDIKPDPADLLRCSFCGNELSRINATYGKKPYVVYRESIVEGTDGPELVQEKLHRQNNVVACGDCSLKITPSSSKEPCPRCAGSKVHNGLPCQNCLQRRRGVMVPTGKVDGAVRSNNRWVSSEEM